MSATVIALNSQQVSAAVVCVTFWMKVRYVCQRSTLGQLSRQRLKMVLTCAVFPAAISSSAYRFQCLAWVHGQCCGGAHGHASSWNLACRAGVCMFRLTFEETFGCEATTHTPGTNNYACKLVSVSAVFVRGCEGRAQCCMDGMATHCGGEAGQHVLKERLLFLQIAGDGGVPAPHVLSQFDPCGGVPRIIGDAISQRLHGGVPGRTAGPASGVRGAAD